MRMNHSLTLPQVAGYLDGEGCFRWQGRQPVIEVTTASRKMVDYLENAIGGSTGRCYNRPGTKPLWRWSLRGELAYQAMHDLMDYLVEKRAQAALLILMADCLDSKEEIVLDRSLRALKRIKYAR